MALQKKEKQPKLSPEMEALINNTHRDKSEDGEKYDIIDSYKFLIMKILTENQDILHTLHNEELESKYKDEDGHILNGDAYRDINIFNFLKIPGIQSTVKNFICFEVDASEDARYNRNIKRNESLAIIRITFRTISHDEDYLTDYGIARQDLLAAIIKSIFDWSNVFGSHINTVYDKGRVADNGYYYREFIYETYTANNLINRAANGGVSYNG